MSSTASTASRRHAAESVVSMIGRSGAVVIMRGPDLRAALAAAAAVTKAGLKVIEITADSPGAFETIAALKRTMSHDCLIGAGTVLDPGQVRAAVDAGADFIVAPNTDPEVLEACHALGVPVMPGALTPTEIVRAHQLGAAFIKVFPAHHFGSGYISDLLAPLSDLKLVPTGGITPENAGSYLRAGAFAVGAGSSIVNAKLIAAARWEEISARAAALKGAIDAARSSA